MYGTNPARGANNYGTISRSPREGSNGRPARHPSITLTTWNSDSELALGTSVMITLP